MYRPIFKVVLLGQSVVGKTSIIHSFVENGFSQKYKPTIGADFFEKEIVVNGCQIKLEIWDTAGQERFKSLGRAFYRGTDFCVLVYDICSKKSFEGIEGFMNDMKENNPHQNPIFYLVGNKIDLIEEREIREEDLQEFMNKYPQIRHFQTSVLFNTGINEIFEVIGQESLKKAEILRKDHENVMNMLQHRDNKPCRCCINRNKKNKKRNCC